MKSYVTDTHALVWYLSDDKRLSPEASAVFKACDDGLADIYAPTICLVEMRYLEDKGRIANGLLASLETHLRSGETGLYLADLTLDVVHALEHIPYEQVPDLPDRVIAATALAKQIPLITRDHKIQTSGIGTIW